MAKGSFWRRKCPQYRNNEIPWWRELLQYTLWYCSLGRGFTKVPKPGSHMSPASVKPISCKHSFFNLRNFQLTFKRFWRRVAVRWHSYDIGLPLNLSCFSVLHTNCWEEYFSSFFRCTSFLFRKQNQRKLYLSLNVTCRYESLFVLAKNTRRNILRRITSSTQPEMPQICCKLWILPAWCKLSTSCSKSVEFIKLQQVRENQIFYNLIFADFLQVVETTQNVYNKPATDLLQHARFWLCKLKIWAITARQ